MTYTVPQLTDYSDTALQRAAGECSAACEAEAAAVRNDAELKAFRDRWMGRKNGILTQINDQWLKGAPKEAKRDAGMRVNELKMRIDRTGRTHADRRRRYSVIRGRARRHHSARRASPHRCGTSSDTHYE